MKCRKHKIKKTVDLGGVMFCKKCLAGGIKRLQKSNVLQADTSESTSELPTPRQDMFRCGKCNKLAKFRFGDWARMRGYDVMVCAKCKRKKRK